MNLIIFYLRLSKYRHKFDLIVFMKVYKPATMPENNYQMEIFEQIANEFSGKEFTKEDLMNKFGEKKEKTEEIEKKENIEYPETHAEALTRGEAFAKDMRNLRRSWGGHRGAVWVGLYSNEEHGKYIIEKDIQYILKAWKRDSEIKPPQRVVAWDPHAYKNWILRDFNTPTP